jgi:RNA polymerase sigma-70 factor (ECF subfamily)
MAHDQQRERAFDGFVREVEPRLRRALVAAYGPQAGRDAALDALGWAWANWERVEALENPAGYLYRVGQTKAREGRRPLHVVPPDRTIADPAPPWVEPNLEPALLALSEQQRVAVVLCHGFQWTHREVADLLDLSPSTVQNHVERGLANLRRALEVSNDV